MRHRARVRSAKHTLFHHINIDLGIWFYMPLPHSERERELDQEQAQENRSYTQIGSIKVEFH